VKSRLVAEELTSFSLDLRREAARLEEAIASWHHLRERLEAEAQEAVRTAKDVADRLGGG